MLKIYLSSVIIWFLIIMSEGILFKKEFIKSRDKLKEYLKDDTAVAGDFKTALIYLILSFIPVIRAITFITKIWVTCDVDSYIKTLEEKNKNE